MSKKAWIVILTIVVAIIADQTIKLLVKTNMQIGWNSHDNWGWSIKWFQIYFIENPGMAFGIQLSKGAMGKLALSLFRIVAVMGIGYYLHLLLKKKFIRFGYIICVAFIFAGALGNILDCAFYGMLFDYAPFLHGRVVDMFYFPLINGRFPDWIPGWGGENFEFFRPIFNLADSMISVSIVCILLFYRGELSKEAREKSHEENDEA